LLEDDVFAFQEQSSLVKLSFQTCISLFLGQMESRISAFLHTFFLLGVDFDNNQE
jgi:hypothetical protein